MDNENYIATSTIFPEWLITFSEVMTMFMAIWLIWEAGKLCLFFVRDKAKLAQILTHEFFTDLLTALVTFGMGLALFLESAESVKAIVILRPWVILLNVLALRNMRKHYKRMNK